jgi:hypothetical protein
MNTKVCAPLGGAFGRDIKLMKAQSGNFKCVL